MKEIALLSFLVLLSLSGCGSDTDESASDSMALVYANRGGIQCETVGMTPEESTQILVSAGIDVLSATCGFIIGNPDPPAVCGEPIAGNIIVHEIPEGDLPSAAGVGYHNVSTLVDESLGTSYVIGDCK